MNEDVNLIEVFEVMDSTVLESLFLISKAFTKEELKKVSIQLQNKDVKNLIIKYL